MQEMHQLASQSSNHIAEKPAIQPIIQSASQSANQPASQSTNQSASHHFVDSHYETYGEISHSLIYASLLSLIFQFQVDIRTRKYIQHPWVR